MSQSNLALVCSLLTLLGATHAAVCPGVTAGGPSCEGPEDCTELQCQLQANEFFVNGTSSISLDPCDDPPLITFSLQWLMDGSFVSMTYQLSDSGTMLLMGPVNISATVEKNATSLAFSVRSVGLQDDIDLIPWAQYDINTTQCLCSSVEKLAEEIQSPNEHDCSATPTCDGVTCQLEVIGNTYIVETDVLSCTTPPAIDVIVKDSSENVLYSGVFDDNTTGVITIAGFALPINVLLIQRPYSIEIEANVTLPFYGTINIVPRHIIILDLSSCSARPPVTPPTAVPTTPPTQSPPPSDAPYLCQALYNLANTTGAELNCLTESSCTGLMCELNADNNLYQLNLLVLPRESSVKARIGYRPLLQYSYYQQWDVVEGSQEYEFQVGPNGTVVVKTNATSTTLTIEIVFKLDGQPDRALVPPTPIDLPSAEGCLWWLPAIQNLPHCSYLLDCQGVQCINYYETVETSSVFIGERCADPIAVQLELADHDDVIVFRGNFTESSVFRSVLGQGVYTGHVDISRSDTELNFSAYFIYGDIAEPFVPYITIPLDQQSCSCNSLVELAAKTQSPLEHDCTTNEACNGIRCEFNIFGSFFYLETILLSCDSPPALETIVEDENKNAQYTSVISETGTYQIQVLGQELPMYVEITHHDYSMDISATVFTPLFGNNTLVPPHTLFLDRFSCPTAIPPPLTPPPTPSPPTYPNPSTPTCKGLVDIAKENAQEPFVCQVATDTGKEGECDSLVCQLDVAGSSYTVTLELYPQGGEYAVSVKVESEDGVLTDTQVKEGDGLSVYLKEGVLAFDFQPQQGNALAIKATITLSNGRSTSLIDSQVPLEEKGSSEASSGANDGVKIGVPVAVVLVVVAATVVILVLASVWLWRRRTTRRQFDFKPMRFSDVQDSPQKEGEAMETPGHAYEQVDSTLTTSE